MFAAGLLVCALWCGLCMPAAARAQRVSFAVQAPERCEVGEQCTVTVMVSSDSGLANCTIYLDYNPQAVSFVSAKADSVASGGMFVSHDFPDSGCVKGAFVTLNAVTEAGPLFSYTFTVLRDIPAPFSCRFDECVGIDEQQKDFSLDVALTGCVLNRAEGVAPSSEGTDAPSPPAFLSSPSSSAGESSVQEGQTPSVPTAVTDIPVPVTDSSGATVTGADGQPVTGTVTAFVTVPTGSSEGETDSSAHPESSALGGVFPWWAVVLVLVAIGILVAVIAVAARKKSSHTGP